MENNQDRPIKGANLCIQETKELMAEVLNNSQLPPGILLMILNEFTGHMKVQNARMIETERKVYEEEVKKHGKEIHKA